MRYNGQKIILDTCIYRKMPLTFEGIDYKNLLSYIEFSKGNLLLSDIVMDEFCDYFTNDYLKPKIEKFTKLADELSKNIYLEKFNFPDLSNQPVNAIEKFKKKLLLPVKSTIPTVDLSSKEIISFLIENKRMKPSKENLRDYLILKSIVNLAIQEPEEVFVFISEDEIYSTESKFSSLITNNITLYKSIAEFLQENSLMIDFLKPELILQTISSDEIENSLYPFIDDFYSFVSDYNLSFRGDFDEFQINNYHVKNIYTYKDAKSQKPMFVAHIIAQLFISFISDDYHYNNYIWQKEFGRNFPFDKNDNKLSIFEDDVTVIYRGMLDLDNKKILNYEFEEYIY